MKNNLTAWIIFSAFLFTMSSAHSQYSAASRHDQPSNNPNSTYAVTDVTRNGAKWKSLRTLDLRTGAYSDILVDLLNNNETQPPTDAPNTISYNGVAAIAHDEKNKRIYYTPMLTDKLYYIDLRTMNRYTVTDHFTGLMPKTSDQATIVTRLVIANDDKGYGLTNDGIHLVRFTTNSNPSVTDLGPLVDAAGNNEMSVHNLCSSFGGDLIADDDDHLYLFTSRNHVFKINIQTRFATYIGTVANLPSSFTTSGAVVDKMEKKIIIVSAVDSSDVYAVSLNNLIARPFNADRPYHPADLANGAVLKTSEHEDQHEDRIVFDDSRNNKNIQLYPNPVTAKEFKIYFTDVPQGTYTVRVMDINGQSIITKLFALGPKTNVARVPLAGIISSGIYIVRVTDVNDKTWYSGKIFVE